MEFRHCFRYDRCQQEYVGTDRTRGIQSDHFYIMDISKEEVNPLLSDGGHFRLYPFFPYHHERKFEMLHIELDPGSRSVSEAHEPGTEEFILVYEGCFVLETDGKRHYVEAGNAIHFQADRPHVYENGCDGNTRICMLIYYQK